MSFEAAEIEDLVRRPRAARQDSDFVARLSDEVRIGHTDARRWLRRTESLLADPARARWAGELEGRLAALRRAGLP